MATIKTWAVCFPQREGTINEDITVEAHSLVIEPSGALSFWVVSPDGMVSILILSYAPGHWTSVHIAKNKLAEVPNK